MKPRHEAHNTLGPAVFSNRFRSVSLTEIFFPRTVGTYALRSAHRGEGFPRYGRGKELRMPGLIVANPKAGSGAMSEDELRARFPASKVTTCSPDDLSELLRGDLRAWSYVGAAGGDGTTRTVAASLIGTGVPLLPIPGGTKNHFAKAVGIGDLDRAVQAADGVEVPIDVGEVNGSYFLNNSSVGAYPRVVERREGHERWAPRSVARLIATLQEIRHGRPLRLRIDGQPQRAWLVFVGNGSYGGELGALANRASLTDNLLDVRVVSANGRFPRTRLLLALLAGRLRRSPVVSAWTCTEVEIDLGARSVSVALDGEVEELRSPLRYRSVARALVVRVPSAAEIRG